MNSKNQVQINDPELQLKPNVAEQPKQDKLDEVFGDFERSKDVKNKPVDQYAKDILKEMFE